MSFLFPLGLIGLVGIPIIIIIYIIQSKYTEQTVSSTYLWHLSDRFLKRKNPLSGLTGLISLILQILTVLAITLAIAHPVFTLPNAANDYRFVLDLSGSMSASEDGETRLDIAKEKISDVISDAAGGSSYKLITVGTDEITVFDGLRDKERAIELLMDVSPSHASSTAQELISVAQAEFDSNTSALVYLVTDKSAEVHNNLELLSVCGETHENYEISDVTYSHSGARLSVSVALVSHFSDAELEVSLYVDSEKKKSSEVTLIKGEKGTAELECDVASFGSFSVRIENNDDYAIDNERVVYNLKSDKSYSTLIVSESGFFFEAVLDALVDSEIRVVEPDEYPEVTEKYGLYIFDSYEPETLPDGSVWLVNADENIPGAGFDVRSRVELPTSDVISKSNQTSTFVRKLLSGVDGRDIYITRYVKYSGMYMNFATLFTYDSAPLIFAGENATGNRQAVIGFDIHESDFALSADFVLLLKNLLAYSFPGVIDDASYTVGDQAVINIISSAKDYKAKSPSGKDIFIDTSSSTAEITLDEVGTYTVTANILGEQIPYYIYSAAHPDESRLDEKCEQLSLSGERTFERTDGEYDPTLLLFVIIIVLFILDWGVYCYEKYQLR